MSPTLFLRLAPLFALATLGGCVIDADPNPPRQRARSSAATPSTESTSGGTANETTGTPPKVASEISLVEVDTDQVMNASPGDGVGVFVEYKKGGAWHVWWTCDTAQSQQACAFTVTVTSEGGDLAETKEEGFVTGETFFASGTTGVAKSSVTNEVKGVTFQTSPGAILRVEAQVEGIDSASSSFLFFVQDGKVNGGYEAALPNPLRFVGKTP